MKKIHLILFSITSLLFFTNCEKQEECVTYETAEVIGIQGPSNALVGEEVTFDIQMQLPNGCGEFDRYTVLSQSAIIKVMATSRHTGCNCSTGPKVVRGKFKTTWIYPNNNAELQFLNNEKDSFISHKIRITTPSGKVQ